MNELEATISQVIDENNISSEWNEGLLNELKHINLDLNSKRKDLTAAPFITIDGEDAKDFDDAIHCISNESSFTLSVAIADVAELVKQGTALDDEAINRGTSIYFPSKVIPMLPEEISNNLCSLVPNEIRNVVVCEIIFSIKGEIQSYNFFEARIRSHKRMTYAQVDKFLTTGSGLERNISSSLKSLQILTKILLKIRNKRGALEIESQEPLLDIDAEGRVKKIVLPKRLFSHQMVEEAMLAANVCAANFMNKNYNFGVYRIHEEPDELKLESLKNFFSLKGFAGSFSKDPANLIKQCLLHSKDQKLSKVLQTVVLQSLKRAEYSTEELGHFGLQLERYSHFTSPIRRYPDLMTHRMIKNILSNTSNVVNKDNTEEICIEMSELERVAEKSSRQVTQQMICFYLKKYVGEEVSAIVTGIAEFGLFAEIQGFYISGLIHVTDLPSDRYFLDKDSNILKGKKTGRSFRLGQNILVTIANVSAEERKITLVPKYKKNK